MNPYTYISQSLVSLLQRNLLRILRTWFSVRHGNYVFVKSDCARTSWSCVDSFENCAHHLHQHSLSHGLNPPLSASQERNVVHASNTFKQSRPVNHSAVISIVEN